MTNKLDIKTIGLITTFEKITRVHVKQVVLNKQKQVIFIVNEGDAGKAIGKGGSNIKRLSNLTKKKIKVIEFHPEVKEFIKNCIAPIQVDNIRVEKEKVTLLSRNRQTRAQIIGRNKENLEELVHLVNKYFNVGVEVKET